MGCFQKCSLLSPQPAVKQCSCNMFLKITVLELFAIVKYFIFHFHEPRDANADAQASFHSAWISLPCRRCSTQKWCACCNCTTYPSTGCISKLSNRSHLKNPVMWNFSSPWQFLLLDSFRMQGSRSCSGEESGWTLEVKLFLPSNPLPLLQHTQGVFFSPLLFKLRLLSLEYLLHKHTWLFSTSLPPPALTPTSSQAWHRSLRQEYMGAVGTRGIPWIWQAGWKPVPVILFPYLWRTSSKKAFRAFQKWDGAAQHTEFKGTFWFPT